jgi:hypothetical protein
MILESRSLHPHSDYLATSYPWSMLWYMLFNDYTDVLSWHACRARHIVLALILDLHLISGHTITVLVLSRVLQVCNRYPPSVHVVAKLQSPRNQLTVNFERLISSDFWFNFQVHFSVIYWLFNDFNQSGKSVQQFFTAYKRMW